MTKFSDIESLRSRLAIDKDALDEALVEQPELFFHVAEQHVLAASRRDQLKDAAKQVYAELSGSLREELATDGKKPTEAQINAAIESSDEHAEARRELIEASREADLWMALKEAFLQRGYMLKDLAALHVTQYYTTESVRGRDASDVRDAAYQKRRREMATKRRRLNR